MKVRNEIVIGFFGISFLLIIGGIATKFLPLSLPIQKSPLEAFLQSPSVDHPLSISTMRKQSYPGSDLRIEETLVPGSNYTQYIASYQSDGFKIYGLLTVPTTPKPPQGYPEQ